MQGSFQMTLRSSFSDLAPELLREQTLPRAETTPSAWFVDARLEALAAGEHICGTGGHDRCRVVFEDFHVQSRLRRAWREWLEADVERRAPAPIDPRHEG
jgi:hypothetical protein